jgi:hypothetical protein
MDGMSTDSMRKQPEERRHSQGFRLEPKVCQRGACRAEEVFDLLRESPSPQEEPFAMQAEWEVSVTGEFPPLVLAVSVLSRVQILSPVKEQADRVQQSLLRRRAQAKVQIPW